MINFDSSFPLGKAHGWGTFPKCGAGLGYHLVLGPLFWECPHPRDENIAEKYFPLPYTVNFQVWTSVGRISWLDVTLKIFWISNFLISQVISLFFTIKIMISGCERDLDLGCRLLRRSKQNYGRQCRPLQPKKKRKKVVGASVGHYKGKKCCGHHH